jgi:hypothetical protein
MGQTDEDMIRELEEILENDTFEQHYKRVNVRRSATRSISFAIRLTQDEVKDFTVAATDRGMTLADFLRSAARAAADGQLDVERSAALGEAKKHAKELNEALSRL